MYIRFMIIYCVLDVQAIEIKKKIGEEEEVRSGFFCELPSHLRNHQNVIFHLKIKIIFFKAL